MTKLAIDARNKKFNSKLSSWHEKAKYKAKKEENRRLKIIIKQLKKGSDEVLKKGEKPKQHRYSLEIIKGCIAI